MIKLKAQAAEKAEKTEKEERDAPTIMDYLLPAATYQSPSRPVRGTTLNTIIEDRREDHPSWIRDGSGTDTDDGTVIYNPAQTEIKIHLAEPLHRPPSSPTTANRALPLPGPGLTRRRSSDELYDESDDTTEFSDSCPSSTRDSMSSRPTSFATESDRNSTTGAASKTKNRYPSITIPSMPLSAKEISIVPPTPPPKIPISPAALSLLPRCVPALHAPPSLDGSSMTSDRLSCTSAPVTPDMRLSPGGDTWDAQHEVRLRCQGDLLQDGTDSESVSPQREIVIEQAIDWDQIGSFPRVPSAISQETSPILSDTQEELGAMSPTFSADRGIVLPVDALQTLHRLAPQVEGSDIASEASAGDDAEMREEPVPASRPRSADGATPASHLSDYSFSQLSIPSPGGFFSSLDTGARQTWFPGTNNRSSNPPSSTTAENFYNVPWNQPRKVVVGRVIEVEEPNTDGPRTAPKIFHDASEETHEVRADTAIPPLGHQSPTRSLSLQTEYDEAYQNDLMEGAAEHLDRTTSWLAAQLSYLAALRESNPANPMSEWPSTGIDLLSSNGENPGTPVQKMVRFLEEKQTDGGVHHNDVSREEHIYYQAFLHLIQRRRRRDGFVHGRLRFDAVQATRIAMKAEHLDQLCGRYEIREPNRPKYSGPFSQNPRATGVLEYAPEQMLYIQSERERGALDQILPSYWVTDALKYLNGGRLLLSHASKRLAAATLPCDGSKGVGKKQQLRVLDLGGNTSCDWAWHCATQFPGIQAYTVSTCPAAANTTVTGPVNHRLVIAPQPWRLPFCDHYFDVISARSLHAMLKHEHVVDANGTDEFDACLHECRRVLKPGGYLEFMLMDADMINAGPLASAMSVEFGFKLKARGYDPMPTKTFLRRLRHSNFVGIKRAWMFLPAGSPSQEMLLSRKRLAVAPGSLQEADAAVKDDLGSTANVASVTGLVGSWMWEQWMLKLQMEMGVGPEHLLRGVPAVIEESRNCNAGWNYLSGWARKPQRKVKGKGGVSRAPTSETVQIKLVP